MKTFYLIFALQCAFVASLGQSITPSDSIYICAGSSQLLSINGTTTTPSAYQWKRDGVTVGTNATLLASLPGSYSAIIMVGGIADTLAPVVVLQSPKPTAAFTFTSVIGCSNTTFFFTDQSTPASNIIAWNWSFGDGSSSGSQNPSHAYLYNITQNYTVTLVVTNDAGCKDTITQNISILRPIKAKLDGTGATTINGHPYFKICSAATATFTLSNASTSANAITNYVINWGDNSPDFVSTTFNTDLTHNYDVGSYTLHFYLYTGTCADTATYQVFVGNTPAGGMVSPGGTTICAGIVKPFLISGTSNNPNGTTYQLTFNDGSVFQTFNHPAPDSVTHIFASSSCGNTSSTGIVNFPNSYGAYLTISNPCGTTAGSILPIYVSDSALAKISISPKDTICKGQTVTITNTGKTGNYVSAGVCTPGKSIWKIITSSPGTPYTILSGSLGSDFGSADPSLWTSGSGSLSVRFDSAVSYSIKLINVNVFACGGKDSTTKTICVNPTPTSPFDIDQNIGCAPLLVNTNNHSSLPVCGKNSYTWTITYASTTGCYPATSGYEYLNGTSDTSYNPQIRFINPGVYSLSLSTKVAAASCTSVLVTKQITVKGKPKVIVNNIPATLCTGQSFTPTSNSTCYINAQSSYAWTFAAGTPASSSLQNPGAINFASLGNHPITLAVTNECGTSIDSSNVNIIALPTASVPANKLVCSGSVSPAITLSGTAYSYSWTNSNSGIGLAASGTGNIPAFNAINNGTTAITATITLTPLGSICNGLPISFTITVTAAPKVQFSLNKQTICSGATSAAVTLTSATAGASFNWTCNIPAGITGAAGSGTSIIPAQTLVNSTNAPILLLYQATASTAGSTSCTGAVFTDSIMVNPTPNVNPKQDLAFCKGTTVPQIAFTGNIAGTVFSWTNSNTAIGLAASGTGNIAAFLATNPGIADITSAIAVTPVYNGGGASCMGTPTSFVISISPAASILFSAPNQGICTGSQSTAVSLSSSTGSASIAWTCTAPAGITGAASSGTNTIPAQTLVNATNAPITVNYIATSTPSVVGGCPGLSTYSIVVNPIPSMSQPANSTLCNGSAATIGAFTAATGIGFTWTNDNTAIGLAASGTGNIPAFNAANNTGLPILAAITVTPHYNTAGGTCQGQSKTFTITVNPTPTVSTPLGQVVCTGTTIGTIALTGSALPGTIYTWTNSNSSIGLAASGTGDINSFVASNSGSLPVVANISVTPTHSSGGISCNGPVQAFTITVNPSPSVSFSATNQTICSGTQTAAITLSTTTPAASMAWTSVTPAGITGVTTSGTSSIPVQTLVNTTLAPIVVNYSAIATTSGAIACAGSAATYSITVNPSPDAIATTSTSSICSNTATNIALSSSISGSTYSWTFTSPASISGAANGSGNTILQTLTNSSTSLATMTYTVTPKFTYNGVGCNGTALNISVTVRPLDAINNSPLTQDMCTGNNSATVVFNSPLNAGATYNWSTTGAAGLSGYATNGSGNLPSMAINNSGTTTTSLVYAISSTVNGCSGLPTNYTILVHPNARAKFIPTDTIKCPPFAITPAVVGLQPYPPNNGVYEWYVNGILIGSGANFPGYSILGEDDSITVKLKTISQFGCKADSMSRKFYTYKLPHPSFNVLDSVGCGPLTVQMVNTTPNIGFFTYAWNFGNGQTSTLAQPGSIVFAPNPNHTDTVYHVTLTISSPCGTLSFQRDVRVKTKPKAVFTPSRTVGCSPMTVTLINTSLGDSNTYFWDFGDGGILASSTNTPVQHTYHTNVLDTFYVKLVAVNPCGSDSITYALYASPNNIHLLFGINGPQHYGCAPHTVAFVNNTSGAISFNWNFGDGNTTTTTANIDTVYHTYLTPGNYTVTLHASNNCTDTSATDFVNVFAKPTAAFVADNYTACQGNAVNFTNQSTGSSSYAWDFGDGTTSTLVNPTHAYALPGLYTVKLTAISTNVPGNVCTDIKQQQVQVVTSMGGTFTTSATSSACAPASITFVNQNRPSLTSNWNFGDGTTGTGDSLTHSYITAGTYTVTLTVTVPGACNYISTRVITVNGPSGNLIYAGGFNCRQNAVRLEVTGTGFNSLVWDFGDGTTSTSALQVIYHSYANPGNYLPKVTLQSGTGCNIQIKGLDSIKADRNDAGFSATPQQHCNYTTLLFQDSSHVFFGNALVKWNFGDGNTASGTSVTHNYYSAGTYTVKMISIGNSGCSDTVVKSVYIQVNRLPVTNISAPQTSCTGKDALFSALIQTIDPVNLIQWNMSNGVSGSGNTISYAFPVAGTVTVRLITGTTYGCFDTATHLIVINPSPIVWSSANATICLGNSTPLVASGALQYQWSPIQGLNCTNCANPIATPTTTTPYVVTGTNSFGCTQTATTVVTVIQPFHIKLAPYDTICMGKSAELLATGASRVTWSPAIGLNNTGITNPVANPMITTSYRAVGYDGYSCFTDTAFVLVTVGKYPKVNLGPDQSLLAGTVLPLKTDVQNGPISTWSWSPAKDLSCGACALPSAVIKNNISYVVNVKNIYGCEASDTIQIKVFCEDSQLFVPNAFTPDGDGINDVLMVRGKGIVTVKYFRVFNRWGELVFERSDFPPNNITYGWDGKIRGAVGKPDIYVYTAAVTCEAGATFVYKGNTSIIK